MDSRISQIIAGIHADGGHCFIVGGWVRDQVRGIDPHDVDVEVFGMTISQIVDSITRQGFQADTAGIRFGVVFVHGVDVQFSVPRRDSRAGVGHSGFECTFDPDMTQIDAAARRDFTMNSMSIDTWTGQIIDPFGGRQDIQAGIIRHTSDAFAEDPMRPMRGIRFASQTGWAIDPVTAVVCQGMVSQVDEIAPTTWWHEWSRFFQGRHPAAGMQAMIDTGWAHAWPQVAEMVGVDQDPAWHPEGDVWTHTSQAMQAAVSICDRDGIQGDERIIIMASVFCHDIGKGRTSGTFQGHIISPSHDQVGADMASDFMASIGAPEHIRQAVVVCVREHMFHIQAVGQRAVGRFIQRISPVSVATWAAVVEADHSGRGSMAGGMPAGAVAVVQMAEQVGAVQGQPADIIMGRHMIEIGMRPGPQMGVVIRAARDAQMAGVFHSVETGVAWVRATFGI